MGRYMRTIVRILRIPALVSLVVCAFMTIATLSYWQMNSKQCRKELAVWTSNLERYIRNEGCFPKSQEELIRRGYLLRKKSFNEWTYDIPLQGPIKQPDYLVAEANSLNSQEVYFLVYFDEFTINYGITLEDIRESGGILYDRTKSQQMFLIKGPRKFVGMRRCEKASYELYLELQRQRNKAKAPEE